MIDRGADRPGDAVEPTSDAVDGTAAVEAAAAVEPDESAFEPARGAVEPGDPAVEPDDPAVEPDDPAAVDSPAPDGGLPGDALSEAQLEALLFVAERPLARRELSAITGASRETIDERLGDLEVSLAGRGIRLVIDGERVALATAPEAGRLIGQFIGREPTRLSQSVLETLAIVAYRQPATKAAIERIRGVDAEYALRSLLHRRLIVELGRSEAPGRPILYGTGTDFLERFGLTTIDDLPVVDAEIGQRLAAPEADAAEASGAAGSLDAPAR